MQEGFFADMGRLAGTMKSSLDDAAHARIESVDDREDEGDECESG